MIWHLSCLLALTLAGLGVYAGVGTLGFATTDDPVYITQNAQVQAGLTAEGVRWAFTQVYFSNWHPLTWLSHMLDTSLFGMASAPRHWMSVGLHLVNGWLLYALAFRLLHSRVAALVAGILFLVHPVHVESVAWLSQRKDLLCGLFYLATLLVYVNWCRKGGGFRYALVLVCCALALLSKPMAVSLPVVLLLLDATVLGRITMRAGDTTATRFRLQCSDRWVLLEKIPLFVMAVLAAAVTVVAQSGAMSSLSTMSLSARGMNAVVACAVYLRDLLLPTRLAVHHPLREIGVWEEFVPALLVLLVTTGVCIWAWKRTRWPALAWLWFLVTLVPVLGIVQVGLQAHADRYLYIPAMGLYLAVAALLAGLPADALRKAGLVSIPVLGFYAILGWIQVGYWSSPHSLWSRSLEIAGDSLAAHNNLFDFYRRNGRWEQAESHAAQLIERYPRAVAGYAAMGVIAVDHGEFAVAEQWFRRAVETGSPSPAQQAYSLYSLAFSLEKQGRNAAAADEYRRALQIDPTLAVAREGLARLAEK